LGWLFPGGQPGRPISATQLTARLTNLGIRPNQARSTALFQLAAEIPAAILARTPGIHTDVAVTWQRLSAGDWRTYAAGHPPPGSTGHDCHPEGAFRQFQYPTVPLVGEARRRDAVDKVTAMQFDRHGNRVWRQAATLLESEHARYTLGEVAVPYGTCTEPSNVQAGGGAVSDFAI